MKVMLFWFATLVPGNVPAVIQFVFLGHPVHPFSHSIDCARGPLIYPVHFDWFDWFFRLSFLVLTKNWTQLMFTWERIDWSVTTMVLRQLMILIHICSCICKNWFHLSIISIHISTRICMNEFVRIDWATMSLLFRQLSINLSNPSGSMERGHDTRRRPNI